MKNNRAMNPVISGRRAINQPSLAPARFPFYQAPIVEVPHLDRRSPPKRRSRKLMNRSKVGATFWRRFDITRHQHRHTKTDRRPEGKRQERVLQIGTVRGVPDPSLQHLRFEQDPEISRESTQNTGAQECARQFWWVEIEGQARLEQKVTKVRLYYCLYRYGKRLVA